MTAAYGPDLAFIHHEGFGGFARRAAPGLLALLRRAGVKEGLVVDLGCGSGIWAGELSRAGYNVHGIDLSPALLARARREAPRARFRTGSFRTAPLPACDAVTAVGEVFSYRLDGTPARPDLTPLLRRIHRALRPGGVLIFDLLVSRIARAHGGGRAASGRDWAVLVATEEDARRGRLTRRITSFRRLGRRYRRSEEVHRLQRHDARTVAQDMREAGFRVRRLAGYGSMRLPPGHAAFLARKPKGGSR